MSRIHNHTSYSDDLRIEVNTRIQMGGRCYFDLGNMFSSKVRSNKLTKFQLNVMVPKRPVVLHGSEAWTLRKVEDTTRMQCFSV